MFDPNAVYHVVAQGGAPAIFLLLVFISLLLSGVLRLNREMSSLTKLNADLLTRVDRQQDLFDRSLDLLERQLPLPDSRRRSTE